MLTRTAAWPARRPRLAPAVAAAAAPWLWFGVRDLAGVPGDLVAIVLPVLAAGLAVTALVVAAVAAAQRTRWLLVAGSVLAAALVAVLGPWLPADAGAVRPGAAITVVGANVMELPDPGSALVAANADVLVVSEWTRWIDPELSAAYPYRLLVAEQPQVGVYSRLPLRQLSAAGPDLPGLRLQVSGPAGEFVLYALHVPRPWYTAIGGYQVTVTEHHRIMAALAAAVGAERAPVVVVGDLNSPDRGRDYRTLLRTGHLVDAMRDRPTGFTSVGKWTPFLLRIDHLLVSPGWCGDGATQLELPGSDHVGISAAVGPCAGGR